MAVKLKGKITLVTGADRGIGRGIVEVFAEEGADVAVNYIEEPEKAEAVAQWVREKGRRSIIVKGDVSRRADVEAMIDKVWNWFNSSGQGSPWTYALRSREAGH